MTHVTLSTNDYRTMPLPQLCELAGVGDEEIDYLMMVEATTPDSVSLSFLLRKIRRILGELAAWMSDIQTAQKEKIWDWASDGADMVEELVDDYLKTMDAIYDCCAQLLAKDAGA